jgi:isopentenyl diphosphate isomerase/L-lactate dehydrogenase-like FMN-dependent dehydrogenase
VKRSLDILHEELDRDLGLLGAASLAGINRRLLVRHGAERELLPSI